jgi:hypothetical protein
MVRPTAVYAIATFDNATARALETARRLAAGSDAHVVLLVPGEAHLSEASGGAAAGDAGEHYRALAARVGVNAAVCLCMGRTPERAFGHLPKGATAPLVIGGRPGRWFWPSAEERLMRTMVRLGYRVVFVDAALTSSAGVV